LLIRFLVWHFGAAAKQILVAWKNFLKFNLHYFSLGLLLKTLFSHWRRYKDSYSRGFDFKVYARVFAGNMISRALGAFIRIIMIIIGLCFELVIFLFGFIFLIVWLCLPFLCLFFIYSAIIFVIV